MRLRHVSLTAVLGIGVLFLHSPASGTNGKSYPGITCTRVSGGTYSTFGGTVSNTSTSSELLLRCPLVKDDALVNNATIKVFDRNSSLDVTCTVFSGWSSGPSIFVDSDTRSSSGFGSNVQPVNFPDQVTCDYYWAECSVPRVESGNVSHVASLHITEYN